MRRLACTALLLLAMLGAGNAVGGVPAGALPRIVVAFANDPHTLAGPAGATGSRYGGGGYRVAQDARREERRVAATYSLREVTSWPIKALSMHCVVYEITDGRPASEVLAALSHDTRVLLAQPLQEFHTLTGAQADARAPGAPYNDPLYDLQTNLVTLGIARAHQRTQGAGVRIALIDTGVDVAHPDLRGRILDSRSFVGRRAPAALRHGTAMAGIIAAVSNNHIGIVGIAPQAQIEVFAACWQLAPGSDTADCNTFTLARALAAALASGAPLVNLSIAGPADPLLAALVRTGLERGVTFVAAAADADDAFPSAIPGVIVAGGTGSALPHGALAAPARHVLTLRPGAQYDFEAGTSVAAAEITGLVALLISASPVPLRTATIVSLLEPAPSPRRPLLPAGTANSDPPPTDINAALARLGSGGGRRALAAGAAR